MKKILIPLCALGALTACGGRTYYNADVKYVQNGADCIYYADEYANGFSDEISRLDVDKKIVYHNTKCADLYARDNFGMPRYDRHLVVSASQRGSAGCGCRYNCSKKHKYVFTPAI